MICLKRVAREGKGEATKTWMEKTAKHQSKVNIDDMNGSEKSKSITTAHTVSQSVGVC